jgi:hypothetical protein
LSLGSQTGNKKTANGRFFICELKTVPIIDLCFGSMN